MTTENATGNGTAEKEKPKRPSWQQPRKTTINQQETTMVLLNMVVFLQNYKKLQEKQ